MPLTASFHTDCCLDNSTTDHVARGPDGETPGHRRVACEGQDDLKFLGSNYDVRASVGHVADLPSKGLNIDVDNGFKPTYELTVAASRW